MKMKFKKFAVVSLSTLIISQSILPILAYAKDLDESFSTNCSLDMIINKEEQIFNDYVQSENNGENYGKLKWAVDIILKYYDKIPKFVRVILANIGLNAFLELVENYKGKLEDALYYACEKLGVSEKNTETIVHNIMKLIDWATKNGELESINVE